MASEFQLETPRLRLRSWRDSDLPDFAAINADPRVMEFLPTVLTREETGAAVERIVSHIEDHGFGLWAVEVVGRKGCAGFVGLSVPRFEAPFIPSVEVGWRLAYDVWGRGLATEAAAAALDDGFDRMGFDEVVSFTVTENYRSQRVMQKLGMTRSPDEDFDHPLLPPGRRLRRHVLYRLSQSAWKDRRRAASDAGSPTKGSEVSGANA